MKNKIDKFEELSAKCEKAYQKLESKREAIEGSEKLTQIKRAINQIKAQVFKQEQRIGIIKSILNYKTEDVKGVEQHHLYDEIEDDFDLN